MIVERPHLWHRRRVWPAAVIVVAGLATATPLGSPGVQGSGPSGGKARPSESPGAERPGPAAGKFLVASRNLRDTNFARTVVLLLNYGPNGAMGLIINRPTALRLSSVFPKFESIDAGRNNVFEGGPVSRDSLSMLVRSTDEPDESRHVFANVHLSTSVALLERLLRDGEGGKDFRVFAGYAGWAAGQLDGEIERDDWYVVDSDTEFVFDADPEETWRQLLPRDPLRWTGPYERPDDGVSAAVVVLRSSSWTEQSIRFASSTSSPGG